MLRREFFIRQKRCREKAGNAVVDHGGACGWWWRTDLIFYAFLKKQIVCRRIMCLASALCVYLIQGGVLSVECLGLSERTWKRMAISSVRVWGFSGVTFGLSRGSVRVLLSSKLPAGSCLLSCASRPFPPARSQTRSSGPSHSYLLVCSSRPLPPRPVSRSAHPSLSTLWPIICVPAHRIRSS